MGKIDASTTSLYYDYDNALNSEDVYSYNFTTGTAKLSRISLKHILEI